MFYNDDLYDMNLTQRINDLGCPSNDQFNFDRDMNYMRTDFQSNLSMSSNNNYMNVFDSDNRFSMF